MSISTATTRGWMPDAAHVGIPENNYATGHASRRAVCLHIIVGSANSAISKFKNPASETSAHFVISKAGLITQLVSVYDTAYANGLSWSEQAHCWVDPQKHLLKAPNPSPTWPLLVPPINPNFMTISIEREGYPDDTPPQAQDAAVVRILRYVASVFPLVYLPGRTLIGHYAISPKSKPNCPGPHVDYAGLAVAANAPASRAYRVAGLPIYQRQDLAGPLAGHLADGETILIDATYPNGAGHDKLGRGFVDMQGLEPL